MAIKPSDVPALSGQPLPSGVQQRIEAINGRREQLLHCQSLPVTLDSPPSSAIELELAEAMVDMALLSRQYSVNGHDYVVLLPFHVSEYNMRLLDSTYHSFGWRRICIKRLPHQKTAVTLGF